MRWCTGLAFKNWLGLFFLLGLARADQVLDFGSLDQYEPHREPPSTLSSNTVWISARDDDEERGFLVAVSSDVKDKLNDALTSCPTLDNSCFQNAQGILRAADMEIDSSVSRRDFALIVSRNARLLTSAFVTLVSVLMAQWRFQSQRLDHPVQFIPAAQATKVATVTNGEPLTISAAGTAIVTVTMTPDPTTVTGSVAPSATAVVSDDQGGVTGDMVITLDESVANRLSEVMHRKMGCKEGSDFDAEQGQKRDATYGNVLCGVSAAMEMATPGAPLHDLTLIQAVTPDLLRHLGAEFIPAAQRAIDITRDYAPLLEMPPEVSFENIVVVVFALGVNWVINNKLPSGRNVIPKNILDGTDKQVTTTATSCTETGTASVAACQATCTELGAQFFACETSCGPCVTQTTSVQTIMTFPWSGPEVGGIVPALPPATAAAKPECQMDQAGILPWNIFSGPEYSVMSQFCASVESQPASSLAWTVDSRGNKKSLLKKVKAKRDSTLDFSSSSSSSFIDKRTPPTDPDTYKDYHVFLRWEPSGSFSCPVSCAEAYRAIADSPCGHTGGDQNAMARSGFLNVGCGTYSYDILVPGGGSVTDTPLEFRDQLCYREDQWPKHGDVSEKKVKEVANSVCGKADKSGKKVPAMMGREDERWELVKGSLRVSVEWISGCTLKGGANEQDTRWPLGYDGHVDCYLMFYENWRNCNNGGVGGSRQVGCLEYSLSLK